MTINVLALAKRINYALVLLITTSQLSSQAEAQFTSRQQGKPVYFLGHLVPDTDSIMSAIVAADLYQGVAVRSGELNLESQYVIERFALTPPSLLKETADKSFVLLDFNQRSQAPKSIHHTQIVGIIDHHAYRDSGFNFNTPTHIDIQTVGSTCTILSKLYKSEGKTISLKMAAALLAGIISDTVNFKSPTTSEQDIQAAKSLARLANIKDIDLLANEMFKAKSNLKGLSANKILLSDFKTYKIRGINIGIGVAETISPKDLIERKEQIRQAMKDSKQQLKLDYIFFAITDTINMRSSLLILGDEEEAVASKAFNKKPIDHLLDINANVSRKKQILPKLQKEIVQVALAKGHSGAKKS